MNSKKIGICKKMGIDPDSQNVVLYTQVERRHENRIKNI